MKRTAVLKASPTGTHRNDVLAISFFSASAHKQNSNKVFGKHLTAKC